LGPQRNSGESLAAQDSAGNQRLDSWKEIAGYLRRDIRTVQFWEKREDLPIHRHTHSARASVYAYRVELDDWHRSRRRAPGAEKAEEQQTGDELAESDPRSPRLARPAMLLAAVVAAVAVVGVLAAWHQYSTKRNLIPEGPILAVLPFENLSPTPNQDYLADGLTDDLITALGRSGRLQVISRTSVVEFKGKHAPLQQIARSLHANLILEGTVTLSAGRVRVTAQLINAESDRHIWAQSYERDDADVLSMQDHIANDVAATVMEKVIGTALSAIPPRSRSETRSTANVPHGSILFE
jgi:TolB-like protein